VRHTAGTDRLGQQVALRKALTWGKDLHGT
jgi:hypothetical protein